METRIQELRWGRFNLIKGDMISNIATYCGEWSDVEVSIFQILLNPDSNIVEVGANMGLHTVPLAKIANQGKVITFEPQRIIFQQLCCNLALNNLTNVYAHRLGVSDQSGKCSIESCDYHIDWNYGSFSLDKGFSSEAQFTHPTITESVEIVNLDDFAPIAELNSLDLLKIDAEGFEPKILNGAVRTIERYLPVLFVEYQKQHRTDLLDFFHRHDYQAYWLLSKRCQEKNHFQAPLIDLGDDLNFVAIPRRRLQDAPPDSGLYQLSQLLNPVESADDFINGKVRWVYKV